MRRLSARRKRAAQGIRQAFPAAGRGLHAGGVRDGSALPDGGGSWEEIDNTLQKTGQQYVAQAGDMTRKFAASLDSGFLFETAYQGQSVSMSLARRSSRDVVAVAPDVPAAENGSPEETAAPETVDQPQEAEQTEADLPRAPRKPRRRRMRRSRRRMRRSRRRMRRSRRRMRRSRRRQRSCRCWTTRRIRWSRPRRRPGWKTRGPKCAPSASWRRKTRSSRRKSAPALRSTT